MYDHDLTDTEIDYINSSGKTMQELRNEMKRKEAEKEREI